METIPEFGEKRAGVKYIRRPGAVAVILDEHNRIAAVEEKGKYFLIGGGIDTGETPHEALTREAVEEVGWELKILRELGQASEFLYAPSEDAYFKKELIFYVADFARSVPGTQRPEYDPTWLSLSDFRKKAAHGSHVWAIEEALNSR